MPTLPPILLLLAIASCLCFGVSVCQCCCHWWWWWLSEWRVWLTAPRDMRYPSPSVWMPMPRMAVSIDRICMHCASNSKISPDCTMYSDGHRCREDDGELAWSNKCTGMKGLEVFAVVAVAAFLLLLLLVMSESLVPDPEPKPNQGDLGSALRCILAKGLLLLLPPLASGFNSLAFFIGCRSGMVNPPVVERVQ